MVEEPLLLDSTYLLPIFGIGLEFRDFESTFTRMLEDYNVKYSPVSLIETKWAIIRRSKKLKESEKEEMFKNYRQGLISLQRDPTLQATTLTNEAIEDSSDALLNRHQISDYFDRQIYSTAAFLRCILLTEDETLHDLFNQASSSTLNTARPARVMRWKELELRS